MDEDNWSPRGNGLVFLRPKLSVLHALLESTAGMKSVFSHFIPHFKDPDFNLDSN